MMALVLLMRVLFPRFPGGPEAPTPYSIKFVARPVNPERRSAPVVPDGDHQPSAADEPQNRAWHAFMPRHRHYFLTIGRFHRENNAGLGLAEQEAVLPQPVTGQHDLRAQRSVRGRQARFGEGDGQTPFRAIVG